jgi:hypothetical protein
MQLLVGHDLNFSREPRSAGGKGTRRIHMPVRKRIHVNVYAKYSSELECNNLVLVGIPALPPTPANLDVLHGASC